MLLFIIIWDQGLDCLDRVLRVNKHNVFKKLSIKAPSFNAQIARAGFDTVTILQTRYMAPMPPKTVLTKKLRPRLSIPTVTNFHCKPVHWM